MQQDNNKENQTPEVKYIETETKEEHEQEVLDTHKDEPKKEKNKSTFDAALLAGILGALVILALIIFFVLVY